MRRFWAQFWARLVASTRTPPVRPGAPVLVDADFVAGLDDDLRAVEARADGAPHPIRWVPIDILATVVAVEMRLGLTRPQALAAVMRRQRPHASP